MFKKLSFFCLIILILIFNSCNDIKAELRKSFELKKGDRAIIINTDLILYFKGAGYSHYINDDIGYEAFLIVSTSTVKDQLLFLESINGNQDQIIFEGYLIILEFSNGIDLCRLKVEKNKE